MSGLDAARAASGVPAAGGGAQGLGTAMTSSGQGPTLSPSDQAPPQLNMSPVIGNWQTNPVDTTQPGLAELDLTPGFKDDSPATTSVGNTK